MGIKFNVKKVKARINLIAKRCKNLKEPLTEIAVDMKNETQNNFDGQHSFDGKSWKKSKRAKEQNGQTLKDTGRLYNSFKYKVGRNYARVGTNVIYARTLNRGADKGEFGKQYYTVRQHRRRLSYKTKSGKRIVTVKAHLRRGISPWGDIPAYRYMGISNEAKKRYIEILKKYILKK